MIFKSIMDNSMASSSARQFKPSRERVVPTPRNTPEQEKHWYLNVDQPSNLVNVKEFLNCFSQAFMDEEQPLAQEPSLTLEEENEITEQCRYVVGLPRLMICSD